MRRAQFLSVAWLAILGVACSRPDPIRLQPTIEEPPTLASVIRISDPSTSSQLVHGFYALEGNAYRWTGPNFAAILQTPAGARHNGAKLILTFSLPANSIRALHQVKLTARAAGMDLAPQEYTTAGEHTYERLLPSSLFTEDRIEADFAVDKFLALPNDDRHLGLVVTRISLEP